MQGGCGAGHGNDGEWWARWGGRFGLQPFGPPAQLPPFQPFETFPVSPVRRHRLPTDRDSPTPGVPVHGGVDARHLQQRQDLSLVPRLKHRLRQDLLFRIAQVFRSKSRLLPIKMVFSIQKKTVSHCYLTGLWEKIKRRRITIKDEDQFPGEQSHQNLIIKYIWIKFHPPLHSSVDP